MGEKLKSIAEMFDERGEIWFAIIFVVITGLVSAPLFERPVVLSGEAYIAGVAFLFSVFVLGRTVSTIKTARVQSSAEE